MMAYFKLGSDGRTPVKCANVEEWAKWFLKANRLICKTKIGDITITTVFLGIDSNFNTPPEMFETMVFDGWPEQTPHTSQTADEALKVHERLLVINMYAFLNGVSFAGS